MGVCIISWGKGLPMLQVGILNLFWVKDASCYCKDDIAWDKLISVKYLEETGRRETFEALGKVYEATRMEYTTGGTLETIVGIGLE